MAPEDIENEEEPKRKNNFRVSSYPFIVLNTAGSCVPSCFISNCLDNA